jgi:nitroreductase
MVHNQDVKDALADEVMLGAGNQYRVRDCSVLAVFLSDLEAGKRIQRVYQLEKEWGKRHPNYMAIMPMSSSFLLGEGHAATFAKNLATDIMSQVKPMPKIESTREWSYKNTSLLIQSYMLAATSHDLATTPMEGFDTRRAMEVLRIPDRYAIPMMVATGYDYEAGSDFTPRLDLRETVFEDSFGAPWDSTTTDPSSETQPDEEPPAVAASS